MMNNMSGINLFRPFRAFFNNVNITWGDATGYYIMPFQGLGKNEIKHLLI